MDDFSPAGQRLLADIASGAIDARVGYLVGLDRPALLSPDPGALLAAGRPDDIIAAGHRWRVVTASLWHDLLGLGRERPEQQVAVVSIPALEAWLHDSNELAELERDGWRANQGTAFVLPIPGI